MNPKQIREHIMAGLVELERVRNYVADARLSKTFPNQENSGPPFDADMGKVEDGMSNALVEFYKGLQHIYTDFEWADSIDGQIPVWEETKDVEEPEEFAE